MSASYDPHDPRRARVFGTFADNYDKWRPGYPVEAADWLLPPHATTVADVGAGTGKLTGLLLGRGLIVTAIEPDAAMLDVLARKWPQVQSICAPAEQLPLDDASVDVVLVGQAWHWFDHERAVREVRRVLRTGGWLGLVGNGSGVRQPWQEQLEALSPDAAGGLQKHDEEEGNPWADLGLAGLPYQLRRFPWRESITPAALRARIATHSAYALMPAGEQRHRLDQLAALAQAEADRNGRDDVSFEHTAVCVRVWM